MPNKTKIIATKLIEDVVNKSSSDRVLIKDLVDAMESVGFGLVMMIFAVGVIIPFPPPVPSVFAMPLLIFSCQMMAGYTAPKLPKTFAKLSIKRSILGALTKKTSFLIYKIERILKPRFLFMTKKVGEMVIGFFIFIFSLSILMPIPFSNFIPGLGILIVSFGLLGKDGLILTLGIMVGLAGVVISVIAIVLGVEAINYVKDLFFPL